MLVPELTDFELLKATLYAEKQESLNHVLLKETLSTTGAMTECKPLIRHNNHDIWGGIEVIHGWKNFLMSIGFSCMYSNTNGAHLYSYNFVSEKNTFGFALLTLHDNHDVANNTVSHILSITVSYNEQYRVISGNIDDLKEKFFYRLREIYYYRRIRETSKKFGI